MKLSVIVATHNHASGLHRCLDSIAASLAALAPGEGEIVLIDNNSTDATPDAIAQWIAANPTISIQHLFEPLPGACRARNRGIAAARGALLVFTDDDCRLAPDYATVALAYDATDSMPVIRGGRIELGDPNDLPITIKTDRTPQRWSRAMHSAKTQDLSMMLIGCNVMMRKTTILTLGGLDERFGPGTSLPAAEDLDLYSRAYLAGMDILYAPDLLVLHDHGRRDPSTGLQLMRGYFVANGGIYTKYLFRYPDFLRPAWWHLKHAVRDIVARNNRFMPEIGFSRADVLRCYARGAWRYSIATVRQWFV